VTPPPHRPDPEDIRTAAADEFFTVVRWLFSLVGGGAVAVTVVIELAAGRGAFSLWLQPGVLAVALAGAWLLPSRRWQSVFICAGLLGGGLVAMLRYGPQAGNAMVMMAAIFTSTLFFGGRGGLAAGVVAGSGFAAVGALITTGVLPNFAAAISDPTRPATWLRIGVSVTAVTAGLVVLFLRLVDRLQRHASEMATWRLRLEEAEREREQALASLAGAQRLHALGRLAAGAAHDFRNALAVVSGAADALRRTTRLDQVREIAGDLEAAATSANHTTTQLVAFGRIGEEGSTCRPDEVVIGVSRTLGRLFPRDVIVEAEVSKASAVAVDEGGLAQALLNLALNARDAMPGGGRLLLRCFEGPGTTGVLVEVADTGVGMDEATRRRALEPFFTTKLASTGTGLGLAMVQDTVTRAGGTVDIESAPGRGTTVRLRLPAVPKAAA
jgi:signal transduction histidine kinase